MVEPQSPSRAHPRDLTSASTESFSAFQFPSLTSQMEIKSGGKNTLAVFSQSFILVYRKIDSRGVKING